MTTVARWGWTGNEPYEELRFAMERLVDHFNPDSPWSGDWETREVTTFPRLNLREEAEGFVLEAELPGLRLEDIDITCVGSILKLRGERKNPGDPPEAYRRRERPIGTFVRSLELPSEVDPAKVTAVLKEGMLEVMIPKSTGSKPRRIDVRAARPRSSPVPASHNKEA